MNQCIFKRKEHKNIIQKKLAAKKENLNYFTKYILNKLFVSPTLLDFSY